MSVNHTSAFPEPGFLFLPRLPGFHDTQVLALGESWASFPCEALGLYFQCPEAQLRALLVSWNPDPERYFFLCHLVCFPVESVFSPVVHGQQEKNPVVFQKIYTVGVSWW